MNHTEAVAREFEDPDRLTLECQDCGLFPAEVRMDSGVSLCTPCAHEVRILRGENFRARLVGTVRMHRLDVVEIELEEEITLSVELEAA